jgi:23S rRNA pseudouridine1911/1915/1917 synthase
MSDNNLEVFEFLIDEEFDGKRVDGYLPKKIDDLSRGYIQTLIEEGNLTINGKVVKSKKHKLGMGDSVKLTVPEATVLEVIPENIPIDIVYEDEDVLIVNKGQGMVVHPAPGNYTGTLVNAIMFHTKDLSSMNGVIRPGIVHRIDKDTSGILMIAKNNKSHNSLAEQLKDHSITRKYYALVMGNVKEDSGTIDRPIGRNPKDRLKMAVVEKNSKRAVTHFRVVERFHGYTLVECQLETGRTHQIRVHMKYLGHPLVGDPLYGNKNCKIKHKGQLLHAKVLGFIHPSTGEYVEFDSELPGYYQKILDNLRKAALG